MKPVNTSTTAVRLIVWYKKIYHSQIFEIGTRMRPSPFPFLHASWCPRSFPIPHFFCFSWLFRDDDGRMQLNNGVETRTVFHKFYNNIIITKNKAEKGKLVERTMCWSLITLDSLSTSSFLFFYIFLHPTNWTRGKKKICKPVNKISRLFSFRI